MIGIYSIVNIKDNKIYIGQSVDVEKRISSHKSKLRNNCHLNDHLQKAWNKYGEESFQFNVIEECSKEELDKKERHYIKEHNSMNPEYGYNLESGGCLNKEMSQQSKEKLSKSIMGHTYSEETIQKMRESHKGKHLSEEAKRKVSEFNKGKKLSPETIEKIRNSNKGKKASEETRRKLSESHKGHKWSEKQRQHAREYYEKYGSPCKGRKASEETRKKISEARKGRTAWNKGIPRTEDQKKHHSEMLKGHPNYRAMKKVMDVTTGIVYNSITEAKKATGISKIGPCANGKRKHAGGHEWKFV